MSYFRYQFSVAHLKTYKTSCFTSYVSDFKSKSFLELPKQKAHFMAGILQNFVHRYMCHFSKGSPKVSKRKNSI